MTGKQLKEKRHSASLTLEAAAQKAGVSFSTWQRWETRAKLPIDIQAKAEGAIQAALDESLGGQG